MKSILSKQSELQTNYANLAHYDVIDPFDSEFEDVGTVCDYIRDMQFFINEEINELILEIAKNRAVFKPWSTKHKRIRGSAVHLTDEVRSEAIDAFCFMMNIMLAAGITPDNIEELYDKVYRKNIKRQNDPSY